LASTISGSTAPKLGFAIISAKLGIAGCMFTGGGGGGLGDGGLGDGGLAAILAAKPTDGLGCTTRRHLLQRCQRDWSGRLAVAAAKLGEIERRHLGLNGLNALGL